MRQTLPLIAALLLGVAIHDIWADPCDRWYRLPFQLASDLSRGDYPPMGDPLYELAYGTQADQEISAYLMADPWQYRDPRDRDHHGWSDVQSGVFTVIQPLKVLVVMPPSWLDRARFVSGFERGNPGATPLQESADLPPFALVQSGGGVEGLLRQVLLESSGEVTVWRRREDGFADVDGIDLVRQDRVPAHQARSMIRTASAALTPGIARVDWNCRLFDGRTLSLTTYDGKVLSRGHWINLRTPSRQAAPVIERLLAFAATTQNGRQEHSRRRTSGDSSRGHHCP